MDRERERAQSRVGADVARRLLATDVLLASREREHEAAPPFSVHCLANDTAWHLAHVLGPRREQTDIGSAEIERVAGSLAPLRPRCPRSSRPATHAAESDRIGEDRNSAPRSCAAAISVRSRGWPKKSGDWTITQLVSSSIAAAMSSLALNRG
jgi:hypothetical protein